MFALSCSSLKPKIHLVQKQCCRLEPFFFWFFTSCRTRTQIYHLALSASMPVHNTKASQPPCDPIACRFFSPGTNHNEHIDLLTYTPDPHPSHLLRFVLRPKPSFQVMVNHLEAIIAPSAIHKLSALARPPPPPPVHGRKPGDGTGLSPVYPQGDPHTGNPVEVSTLAGMTYKERGLS